MRLRLEYWPTERLVSYANNPRRNDHVVGQMSVALREFGFLLPVLALANGEIIDGHLRLKGALAVGMSTVPVIPVDGLSTAQVRALRIVINRSATWAEWDEDALLHEMQTLLDVNFDLALTGFDQHELDELLMKMEPVSGKDPDAIPETPVQSRVRNGEVWILGHHRLLCGDSTSAADMRLLLQGESVDMVWTDPPYNVDYKGKAGKIQNDKMSSENFDTFLSAAHARMFNAVRPGGAVYVAHSEAGDGMAFRRAFLDAGFKLSSCLIWRKQASVLGRGDYHHQHEPILYGWRPGAAHRWYGNRKQKTVFDSGLDAFTPMPDGSWQLLADGKLYSLSGNVVIEELDGTVFNVPRPARSELHPTTKPVTLIERMVANSSPARGLVLDPFGGSGSTLMACEMLGRKCRTLELDSRFAEVIICRWQEYTGLEAQREGDGVTLAMI